MADQFDFDEFFETQITLPPINTDVVAKTFPIEHITTTLYKKREGELMETYLKYNSLTQQHIDVYNQFLTRISNIISAKEIILDDGRRVRFENLNFDKPFYKVKNEQKRILYPQYARSEHLTYDAELTANLIIRKNDKIIYTSKNRILLMKMPVMLFSMLCHLENKTAQELIELGEDPIEQGGYFIIEGVEKIIMLEEKLSTNRMFIMPAPTKIKKYATTIRLITNTSKGTLLNELIFNNNKTMKYSIQYLRKKNLKKGEQFEKTKKINVIFIYQLFSEMYLNKTYCYKIDDIKNLIRIYLINSRSLDHFHHTVSEIDLLNHNKPKSITPMDVLLKKANQTNLSDVDKKEFVKNLLKSIFEHDDIDPFEGEKDENYKIRIIKTKITLLSIMVAKFLDYLSGEIQLDNRDDWANKRVEGPGRKMEQLTRIAWNKVTKNIVDNMLRENMNNEEIEKVYHSNVANDAMNKIFRDSFINSKWGPKGGNQKNNVTQTLVRDNMFATLSHINTINVNIQRTDKKIDLRLEQSSQYRYICYVKTPEGSNCYHINTGILLKNGDVKCIGDLKNGDEVMTINPLTLEQSPSKIFNHFIKSTEEYGCPVFKITTLNGREIIATDDHPFLTQRGMVMLKDLDIKNDKLVIYPGVKPLPHIVDQRTIVLDENIVRKRLQDMINSSAIEKAIVRLKEKSLLPLYNDDYKLPIIARIAGFTLADGSITITKQKTPMISYCFGCQYDGYLFFEDLRNLGFDEQFKLKYRQNLVKSKRRQTASLNSTWHTQPTNLLAYLMLSLDLMYGKRVEKESKPVPDWVMNGSILVKREFVAGFQGGDGSKIYAKKRKGKVNAYNVKFPHTVNNKCPEHLSSLIMFFNQLVDIFTELKIKVSNIKHKLIYEDRYEVKINFSSTNDNIINYMDTVGYRYCVDKSTFSYHISEYLKYKQNKIEERNQLKSQILNLTNEGYNPSEISKKLVSSILEYTGLGNTLAPKDTMGLKEWLNITSSNNNCVFMPIKSIEPEQNCMVADFTTLSDNHSMVADGFVASNCGLLKNIALTTRLSLDRGIEGDRIIQNYITTTMDKTTSNKHILMLNGKYIGWCNGEELRSKLITLRRQGSIYYDTSFYIDSQFLYIDASPSRLISPVLIVDEKSQRLILDMKDIQDLNPENLIQQGAMEYISAWEEKNLKIAEDVEHLLKRKHLLDGLNQDELSLFLLKNKPYTHCEISGRAALGVAADSIPFMTYNQPARNVFQCLWKETPVLMSDGSRKKIKDIMIGDEVITFDPDTMVTSTTKVIHQYVKHTDKIIYKIKTKSGREITATEDHKFMTNQGWCEVRNMNMKTLLVMYLDCHYVYETIDCVRKIDNVDIADITTESENHSFIAGGGFCVHNSSMITQAVSNYHLNYKSRFDGTVKVLESPTPPIVKTAIYDTLGLAQRGMGQNVIVAFMAYPGTEEDAFIFNQGSIDRGLFRMVKYFNYDGKVRISDPNVKSYFGKPQLNPGENEDTYQHINMHGLPIIGSYIKAGQCVIGIIKEKDGVKYNRSIYLNYGDEGIVDDVRFHETDVYEIISVKLHVTRIPEKGDKYAARMAQKGTIGNIKPYHAMPFSVKSGITPDIIVNTTVIPSRMTISYLMEMLAGKAAAYYGETIDGSAFQDVDFDIIKQKLKDVGFNPYGYEILRDGETGKLLDVEIFMGVVYMQALKHQPVDKMSVRSVGTITSMTQQPVKGRPRGGGLRFGGMEVDTLIAHGSSAAIKERLCDVSDKYKMAICKPCGTTAVYNDILKLYECPVCNANDVRKVTLPYSLKYHNHIANAMAFNITPKLGQEKHKMVEEKEEVEKVEEVKEEEEEEEEEEESEEVSDESEEESDIVDIEEEEEVDENVDYDIDDEDY
ncbi:MAG TPA: hypothetical protein VLG50_07700 [Candidatus Saccharimonadales bacterium]|nr:hypothetical protein [Candidatus Saccharimonadales bacterium]